MTAKFEEEPPLSSKAPANSQNPQDLLNFVTNLQINDGERADAPVKWSVIICTPVLAELVFIPGGSTQPSKRVNKVSVIGGGDLGMASVMSILSKVL